MYEAFYGLRERPFDLTPNPRFLMLTAMHREALSNLQYGLQSRRGLTVLVGEAGTGKTTLIRAAVDEFGKQNGVIGYLNNPTLTRTEFCEFLVAAFGLDPAAAHSKVKLLGELRHVLERHAAESRIVGLILDEAQGLPDELLEEVRLLANLETSTDKLLPIVLAGQPELADRLNRPSLRQLKQRVALRTELRPLSVRETGEYIATRIRIAGGNSAVVFTRQAVDSVFERSAGIPRLISVICDNALISGFAADRRPVSRDIVEDVCRDFDLGQGAPAAPQSARLPAPGATPRPSEDGAKNSQPEAAPRRGDRSLFEHFSVRRRFSLF